MTTIDPDLPPALARRYEALALLGRGGMGRVLRVRRRDDDRLLALKLMVEGPGTDGVSPERFRLEAELARRSLHEDLVGIVESGCTDDGVHYLVMELVPGVTLRHELATRRPLTRDRALDLGARLADVLGALHGAGVVHRDLKPENVMLQPDGRVRLLDLGIARLTERTAQLTAEGILLGTPAFMAPEVCRGEPPGPPADVFALGVLLLDCLSPSDPLPATARDRLALLAARAAGREPLTPHRGLDPPLRSLLLRLLDPDPARRPLDGTALAKELRTLAAAAPPATAEPTRRLPRPAPPPPASSSQPRSPRRFALVCLLLLGGLLAWGLRPGSLPPPPPSPALPPASDPALVTDYGRRLETWLQSPRQALPQDLRESALAPDGALQDLLYRRLMSLTELDLPRAVSEDDLASSSAAFLGLADLAASALPPPSQGSDLDGASAYFAMQYVKALAVREQVVTRDRIFESAALARSATELARQQVRQVGLPISQKLRGDIERLRERQTPRCRRLVLDLAYATALRVTRLVDDAREFVDRGVAACSPDPSPSRRLEAILWRMVAAETASSRRDLATQAAHAQAAMALAPRWTGEHMSLAERAAIEAARDHVRSLLAEGREDEALGAGALLLQGRDDERYRPHVRRKLAEFWEHRGDAAMARRIAAGEALEAP